MVLTQNLQTMNTMPVSELLPAVSGQQKQIKAMVQTNQMIQNVAAAKTKKAERWHQQQQRQQELYNDAYATAMVNN